MKNAWVAAVWLAASPLFAQLNVRQESPRTVAIRDAHVVTVSGADLARATVVIRDGLIDEVGANAEIPAGAWVIDGTGLTVYPGFIDALSTWGIPSAIPPPPARAAGGVPQNVPIQNATTGAPPIAPIHGPEDRPQMFASVRAADQVMPSDSRLEAARAAGFTSAATFPNGGIFEGLGAMIDLAGQRGRDMVVAQPLGEEVVFHAVGGPGRSFPASLMGNIAYVRQIYLDLDNYEQAKQIYSAHPAGNHRPEYDHDLEGLAESPRLLLPADEAQQIDRMLAFGQELKTPFMLYGMHEAFKRVDELKQAQVSVLVSLKWPEKPKDPDPTDVPNYRDLMIRSQAPAAPGLFAKAGVRFAFYSDGVDTAPELKKAIKKAVEAGLSRADAVRALTLNAAEIYGVSDRLGSIEKGKIANMILVRGDVFEPASRVEYVFVDGVEFQPAPELQEPPPSSSTPGNRPHRAGDGGEE